MNKIYQNHIDKLILENNIPTDLKPQYRSKLVENKLQLSSYHHIFLCAMSIATCGLYIGSLIENPNIQYILLFTAMPLVIISLPFSFSKNPYTYIVGEMLYALGCFFLAVQATAFYSNWLLISIMMITAIFCLTVAIYRIDKAQAIARFVKKQIEIEKNKENRIKTSAE